MGQNADAMWRIEFEVAIATSLPDGEQIAEMYRYGYLAECNDAMARLFGADRAEQLIGARLRDLGPPGDPRFRLALTSLIHSEYGFITAETPPLDQNGGRRYFVRTQWEIVENGALRRIWGSIRDVSDLKRSEVELRGSNRRLTEVLDSVGLAAVVLERDGSIGFC